MTSDDPYAKNRFTLPDLHAKVVNRIVLPQAGASLHNRVVACGEAVCRSFATW